MKIEYKSNNSGGRWWLSDKDWKRLEAAGWTVEWENDRFLDALARRANKDFPTMAAAIREFEEVTGQDANAEGCSCCGVPHEFGLTDHRSRLEEAEQRAAEDPTNAQWQSKLSSSFASLGHRQLSQGDLAGALKSFRQDQAIRERLAAQDPANADWQRDLSFSFHKVGTVQRIQGDLAGALASHYQGLAIAERLAPVAMDHAVGQLDLAEHECDLGLVRLCQGQKDEARRRFERVCRLLDRLEAAGCCYLPLPGARAYARWKLADCADLQTAAGRGEARMLLGEAAAILHAEERERQSGFLPWREEAGWQREIEHELAVLKP